MSELNCSTIPCLGSMEKGEFILLAIEVVGYFDRSAGIQRSLQMGTFQRVVRRVFSHIVASMLMMAYRLLLYSRQSQTNVVK